MASLQEAVDSFSPLSKGLSFVFVGGYLLQLASPSAKLALSLVAGRTLPCVWNVVTSGLLQDNPISLAVFVAALLYFSRIIEPHYGQREFAWFLLIALAGSGVLTFVLITAVYYVAVATGVGVEAAGALLYLPVCGFQGGLAALLVALKQLIPDNEVTLLHVVHFRVRHLAGLYVLATAAVGALTGIAFKLTSLTIFGTFTAWVYLRYFQVKGAGGLQGEPSEDFRFASFFPGPAQPAADALAAACGAVARLGGGDAKGGAGLAGAAALVPPQPDDPNTARRRERGVRALEERLGQKAPAEQAQAVVGGAAEVADVEAGTTAS